MMWTHFGKEHLLDLTAPVKYDIGKGRVTWDLDATLAKKYNNLLDK